MEQTNNPSHKQEILAHLHSLHGSVPKHRTESKRRYSFSGFPFADQLAIWDELWRTETNFWIRLHAYFFLERHCNKEVYLKEMWPVIVHWQNQVDDWGLCDALAKIYTKILVVEPQKVYEQLKAWNTDKDLWKRRQSVVSLLYYSSTKKSHPTFDQVKQLLVPLLADKEYYVQKGVGWTLRELRNVYPTETIAWLKQDIRLISPIAFTIAIEKLDKVNIDQLKAIRKVKSI